MPDDNVLLLERHFGTAFAAPDGIQKLRLMQEYLAIDRQMKAAQDALKQELMGALGD